jgi:hypothetical protein
MGSIKIKGDFRGGGESNVVWHNIKKKKDSTLTILSPSRAESET